MISIHAKKHDDYSVEFKFGFNCIDETIKDRFSVNAWIFVPKSLDITPENYGKDQFYRDIKSNVRLITPTYLMRDIAQGSSLPMTSLKSALEKVVTNPKKEDIEAYQYHLKMFVAIFKSALRDQSSQLRHAPSLEAASGMVADYVRDTGAVLASFRSLYHIIGSPAVPENVRTYFRLCDEFMSDAVEMRTLRIVKALGARGKDDICSEIRKVFMKLIEDEHQYKIANGYGVLTDDNMANRQLVHHHGMLKKFIESELYIDLKKRRDGVAIEQLYYSIAAGLAMIFATGVAWYTQVKYGNITWPLFVVLVVSYMLKDRIKDLLRYYFAHRLGNKYFDKKADINIGTNLVGKIKEGFDFISSSRTPENVMKLREKASAVEDESHIFEEKILLYRKNIIIDAVTLAKNASYPMSGINEIMRLHLTRFTHKMDNPSVPVDSFDDKGNVFAVDVQKVYYIHIVFQLKHDDDTAYRQFRIAMTRKGILSIDQL